MKRKTIDAWHEARMTVVQILIPTGVAAFALDGRYPDLKYKVRDKFVSAKETAKNKIDTLLKKDKED